MNAINQNCSRLEMIIARKDPQLLLGNELSPRA